MQLCNRVLIRTQHRLTLNTVYRLTIYTDTSSDKYLNRRINLRLINRRFILRFRLVARLRKYCFISHTSTLNRGWIIYLKLYSIHLPPSVGPCLICISCTQLIICITSIFMHMEICSSQFNGELL